MISGELLWENLVGSVFPKVMFSILVVEFMRAKQYGCGILFGKILNIICEFL
jgi:hypothetical protein